MQSQNIRSLAEAVITRAAGAGVTIAAAESCTAGLVSAALTDVPGSSAVFDRAFVTYSNEAKAEMLGVSPALITRHGAVSQPVARAMAAGALKGALPGAHGSCAVAITGIAGPGGGTAEKPVGLVWFGLAASGHPVHTERHVFVGGRRDFVRMRAVETALRLLLRAL